MVRIIFFFFDAVENYSVLPCFPNRDTVSAIRAIDEVLWKMKDSEDLPVVDGNPITAQTLFAQHGYV